MTTIDADLDAQLVPDRGPGIETFSYDNETVRRFAMATAGWGLVAFLVGLIIALKLIFPDSWAASRRCRTGACGRCTPTR